MARRWKIYKLQEFVVFTKVYVLAETVVIIAEGAWLIGFFLKIT